jgi:pimeloyl-ACP methyl ester carboxylesterase
MTGFILIHGSWHDGSVWYRVEEKLKQAGFSVLAPTLAGFESIENPPGKEVGLQRHIKQIVDLIELHDLTDIILVGHSYSGLVISGIAEVLPERLRTLVYLDAFIPEDQQSLFDIIGAESEQYYRGIAIDDTSKGLADGVQGWLLPPGKPQDYGVMDPQDVEWLKNRMVYTPILTFEESVHLSNPQSKAIPRFFIRCSEFPYLAAFEIKARELGWKTYEIRTGHDAMLTEPSEVSRILTEIAD